MLRAEEKPVLFLGQIFGDLDRLAVSDCMLESERNEFASFACVLNPLLE
jgi:hypothetical protein